MLFSISGNRDWAGVNQVAKNIREIAALPSSGLTGTRKHLIQWAEQLEQAVKEIELSRSETQKAFEEFAKSFAVSNGR